MLLPLLLACTRPEVAPAVPSCLEGDDPPGDPVYRNCVIVAEREASWTVETHTDAEGRTIYQLDEAHAWTWEREWEGSCEAYTHTSCLRVWDGRSCGDWVETRVCDTQGNVTTLTTVYTDGEGVVSTTIVDTSYSFDDEGHPVVAVATERGSDAPPSTTTCSWSDWEGPDRCVENPTSDDEAVDDWEYTWTYDADDLLLEYVSRCTNPGEYERQTWERDERGRSISYISTDSNIVRHYEYTYREDGALDRADIVTPTAVSPIDYTYEVVED